MAEDAATQAVLLDAYKTRAQAAASYKASLGPGATRVKRTADNPVRIVFTRDLWDHVGWQTNPLFVSQCVVPCSTVVHGDFGSLTMRRPNVIVDHEDPDYQAASWAASHPEFNTRLAVISTEPQTKRFLQSGCKQHIFTGSYSLADVEVTYGYGMLLSQGTSMAAGMIEAGLSGPRYTPPDPKTRILGALVVVSNCAGFRSEYIPRLMKLMTVHSLGGCWPTTPPAGVDMGGRGDPKYHERKAAAISRFRFHLSFENTFTEGYMSEKFFELAQVDTVMVYWGPPTGVRQAFPPSVIDGHLYPDPEDLADFLNGMTDEEWSARLAWRQKPDIHPELDRLKRSGLTEWGPTSWICRLCEHYHERWDWEKKP